MTLEPPYGWIENPIRGKALFSWRSETLSLETTRCECVYVCVPIIGLYWRIEPCIKLRSIIWSMLVKRVIMEKPAQVKALCPTEMNTFSDGSY